MRQMSGFFTAVVMLVLFVTSALADLPGHWRWVKTFGGTLDDRGTHILRMSDGGYAFLGSTKTPVDSVRWVWIMKLDAMGDTVWTKREGMGYGVPIPRSLGLTGDDDIIIAGDRYESVNSNDWGVFANGWLRTFSAEGAMLHSQRTDRYPYDGYRRTAAVWPTPTGFIFAGLKYDLNGSTDRYHSFVNTVDTTRVWSPDNPTFVFDVQIHFFIEARDGGYLAGGEIQVSENIWQAWLMKVRADGTRVWSRTYETESSVFNAAIADDDGGFTAVGSTRRVGTRPLAVKIDRDGLQLWRAVNVVNSGVGLAVCRAHDRGALIVGKRTVSADNRADHFHWKIDSLGSTQWMHLPSEPGLQQSLGVTADGADGYLIVGETDHQSAGAVDAVVMAIRDAGYLRLTSPANGDSAQVGFAFPLTWSFQGPAATVKLEYYADSTWRLIDSAAPNTGTYLWTVPYLDSVNTTASVRISALEGLLSNQSPGVMIVSPPNKLVLKTPNGRETWGGSQAQWISWVTMGILSSVRLDYTLDGTIWHLINESTPNDGFYLWEVPSTPSSSAIVRISSLDGSLVDQSDSTFSIAVGVVSSEIRQHDKVYWFSFAGNDFWFEKPLTQAEIYSLTGTLLARIVVNGSSSFWNGSNRENQQVRGASLLKLFFEDGTIVSKPIKIVGK